MLRFIAIKKTQSLSMHFSGTSSVLKKVLQKSSIKKWCGIHVKAAFTWGMD